MNCGIIKETRKSGGANFFFFKCWKCDKFGLILVEFRVITCKIGQG